MSFNTNYLGDKWWRNKEDEFHRLNGPAIEWSNGRKFYRINGEHYNNFISYIKAVIEFRKLNSFKDKI